MYPNISDLIEATTACQLPVKIKTFTFFLMLGLVAAFYILLLEIKRKEARNLMYGSYNSKGEYIKPHRQTFKIILVAAFSGIIGAKALAIIENPGPFLEAPVYVLFSTYYFVFHGGFILCMVSLVVYIKSSNLRIIQLMDALAPAAILGYAIGRLGCYFSGDWTCGIGNAQAKPHWLNKLPDWLWTYGEKTLHPVFPTQLYEALICGIIFCLLWGVRRFIQIPGTIFSLYLLLYGVERFLIEYLRTGYSYDFFDLSIKRSQLISSIIMLIGCSVFYLSYRKYKKRVNFYGDYLKSRK